MFHFKYSNNTEYPFNSVYIGKRNSHIEDYTKKFNLLYPNGHTITELKKEDLLELIPFIHPIKHSFYYNFKVNRIINENFPDRYYNEEDY